MLTLVQEKEANRTKAIAPTPYEDALVTAIKRELGRRGVSLRQASKEIGISAGSLSGILNGNRKMGKKVRERVRKWLSESKPKDEKARHSVKEETASLTAKAKAMLVEKLRRYRSETLKGYQDLADEIGVALDSVLKWLGSEPVKQPREWDKLEAFFEKLEQKEGQAYDGAKEDGQAVYDG